MEASGPSCGKNAGNHSKGVWELFMLQLHEKFPMLLGMACVRTEHLLSISKNKTPNAFPGPAS